MEAAARHLREDVQRLSVDRVPIGLGHPHPRVVHLDDEVVLAGQESADGVAVPWAVAHEVAGEQAMGGAKVQQPGLNRAWVQRKRV